MSAAETTTTSVGDSDETRSEMVAAYFDRLHTNGAQGWMFVGVGHDPYVVAPGKVKHDNWHEQAWRWPVQRAGIIEYIVTESRERDVYVTPGLSENPVRTADKRKSRPSRWLWVDVDGASQAQLAQVGELSRAGSFNIASGRGASYGHLYVALDELVDPGIVETLNRRLVELVRGDPSPSALNGYLRPPGTYNYKPVVLRGEPRALVQVATESSGTGWPISHLDELLPPERHRPTAEEEQAAEEPLPESIPDRVTKVLDEGTGPDTDRSARTMALAGACRAAGFTLGQTLTAARQHAPTRARFGGVDRRLDVAGLHKDVRRCWSKVSDLTDGSDRPSRVERKFMRTDMGNAERLVARFGDRLHYCHDQGHWLNWTGSHWRLDRGDVEVTRFAKRAVRAIYEEAAAARDDDERKEIAKWAAQSEADSRLRAMLHLARTEPGIPVAAGDLDANPMLLNVNNGTIDLRTGKLRAHRREDLCAKLAPVDYDPEARSELWERFLADVTGNESEFIAFLARAVGYSLTGSTAEEILLFVHGPGATGKSTLIEAVTKLLGPYAVTADFETFVDQRRGGANNDVARLAGARLVSSVEVDDGRRLAEGLVKHLTGGDRIAARFLFREHFEFTPAFTLWLVANHAPQVRHEDDAVWRRILRVPFSIIVPKQRRDPTLKATLKDPRTSGPAILAWAVRGCLEWQRRGLDAPALVEAATAEYRDSQDPLREFLEDRCILGEDGTETSRRLRSVYESWARSNGEEPISTRAFGDVLRGHGCIPWRARHGRGWRGIRLVGEQGGDAGDAG